MNEVQCKLAEAIDKYEKSRLMGRLVQKGEGYLAERELQQLLLFIPIYDKLRELVSERIDDEK